ncbi:MAG: DUF3822 family protein [Bacteroidales bacterium]|nr:DUF3822 family protein [Candidatus Sodaliphilus aphodohippi]
MTGQDNNAATIKNPELWTLEIGLEPSVINYILFTDAQEDSLIYGTIELDASTGNYLKSVENAVYENPILLNDYQKVKILYRSQRYVVIPGIMDDDESAEKVLAATYGDSDGDAAMCHLHQCGVRIAFETEKGLMPFLQRTFNNPPIYHHLYPLCEHYNRINEGSGISRMFLNLGENYMDAVIYKKGKFILANTYQYRNDKDAAFFALTAWDSLGLDRLTDELQLTGDKERRAALAPALREYIGFVMPAIYPAAALRIGQNAMKAPIDLILLALCE